MSASRTNKSIAATTKAEDPRITAARAAFAKKTKASSATKKTATAQAAEASVGGAQADVLDAAEPKLTYKQKWDKLISSFYDLQNDPEHASHVPSWKRVLCALAVSTLVGFGISSMAAPIISLLVLSTAALTASAFMSALVMILASAITLLTIWFAGSYAFTKVMDGTVERKLIAAKNWVTGLFSSDEAEPLHV